ncbi:MAG: hypothetical protein Q9195_002990 [Heterodermia aff. obscurata]
MAHIWDPARYTLGAFATAEPHVNHSENRPYICLILNQSVENVEIAHAIYQNAQLIKDNDQYSTDFMKCLRHIGTQVERILGDRSKLTQAAALDVVVLGGLGGRADQAFSQIHHLYLASEDISLDLGDIYLVTPQSIMFVLHKGMNSVRTPVSPRFLTENVGIIPIGRPSIITTKGLEWDVEDWPTEFGTQISTSNHVKADVVRVKTTERALFTVELADSKKSRMP